MQLSFLFNLDIHSVLKYLKLSHFNQNKHLSKSKQTALTVNKQLSNVNIQLSKCKQSADKFVDDDFFPIIAGSANSNTTGDSAEIHRLERELQEEKDRVQRLSAQLTTNVRYPKRIKLDYPVHFYLRFMAFLVD